MDSTAWLPPAALEHPDLIAAVAAGLRTISAVWLDGGTPSSRLALAHALALADGAAAPAVARLAGCRTVEDVILCVGEAVSAPVPGSAVSVGAHLRQRGLSLVILDDADAFPEPSAALEQLAALAPETRWLCLAAALRDPDSAEDAAPCHHLPPTPTPTIDAALAAIPAEVSGLLLLLPAGLPLSLDLGALGHPRPAGRTALRCDVAARLREAGVLRLEASQEAERLRDILRPVLALAEGGALHAGLRIADLLALRWMGEVLADPDAAARATAAAARLLMAWGQLDSARRLLEASLRRDVQASPAARALLRWAEADTLLASGAAAVASYRYDEAEALLRDSRDAALLATIARRRADALAVRGLAEPAARAYQRARTLSRQLHDDAGVAAALRGTADLSVGQGELIAAEALYDQLEEAAVGPDEAANQAVGRAGLAISQSALGQAVSLLAAEDAPEEPLLLQANRARRRADLALRQGRPSEAVPQAQRAAAAYARAGERVSLGHTTRLLGDAAATAGRLGDAAAHYQRAIALQIEVGDLRGLERTLAHAAALEEVAADPAYGERLRTLLRALRRSPPP